MRHSTKMTLVCLAVTFTLAFLGLKVFADGGGAEQAPGEPPYGLSVIENAPGQKLTGELFTEDWDYGKIEGKTSTYAVVLRVAVRLRSGKVLQTYFTDLNCTDKVGNVNCDETPNDPNCLLKPICTPCWDSKGCYDAYEIPTLQKALMTWVMNDQEFCNFLAKFKLNCGTISLKRFVEYASVEAWDPSNESIKTNLHLSNIEIAVK